jgi:hypothetical protein
MGKYRIFFVYRIKDLNVIHVHGMNMEEKKLFTVLLSSPMDQVDLSRHQYELPDDLLSVLEAERNYIDTGVYDIAHWEPYTYQ